MLRSSLQLGGAKSVTSTFAQPARRLTGTQYNTEYTIQEPVPQYRLANWYKAHSSLIIQSPNLKIKYLIRNFGTFWNLLTFSGRFVKRSILAKCFYLRITRVTKSHEIEPEVTAPVIKHPKQVLYKLVSMWAASCTYLYVIRIRQPDAYFDPTYLNTHI